MNKFPSTGISSCFFLCLFGTNKCLLISLDSPCLFMCTWQNSYLFQSQRNCYRRLRLCFILLSVQCCMEGSGLPRYVSLIVSVLWGLETKAPQASSTRFFFAFHIPHLFLSVSIMEALVFVSNNISLFILHHCNTIIINKNNTK